MEKGEHVVAQPPQDRTQVLTRYGYGNLRKEGYCDVNVKAEVRLGPPRQQVPTRTRTPRYTHAQAGSR